MERGGWKELGGLGITNIAKAAPEIESSFSDHHRSLFYDSNLW